MSSGAEKPRVPVGKLASDELIANLCLYGFDVLKAVVAHWGNLLDRPLPDKSLPFSRGRTIDQKLCDYSGCGSAFTTRTPLLRSIARSRRAAKSRSLMLVVAMTPRRAVSNCIAAIAARSARGPRCGGPGEQPPGSIGDRMQFNRPKRRDFMTLVGGVASRGPSPRAQQADRMRRLGVLMTIAENDAEGKNTSHSSSRASRFGLDRRRQHFVSSIAGRARMSTAFAALRANSLILSQTQFWP